MQHPAPDDKLLFGYLLRELDAEQDGIVEHWLASDENNREHLQNLARVWKLSGLRDIDNIDTAQEWSDFVALRDQSTLVEAQETVYEKPDSSFPVRALLVAASLILVSVFGWMLFKKNPERPALAVVESSKDLPVSDSIQFELNLFLKERAVNLPDGSSVILYPGSSIYYNKYFPKNQRDITLTGKGRFNVFKDRKRPFTVHSGKISTTALGTDFTVNAYPDSTFFTVRLHEGRIVVRSPSFPKPFYLKPGQELSFNTRDSTTKIHSFKTSSGAGQAVDQSEEEPIVITGDKGSWYMFNNQSLPDVFEQLQEMYRVDIIYNKSDLKRMYFIGKFDRSDSIQNILEQIARLNSLSLSKVNGKFLIKK